MLETFHINGFDQIGVALSDGEIAAAARTPRLIESNEIFQVAPHMAKLVYDPQNEGNYNNGLRSGSPKNWDYFSNAWYYVQLLTTDNSRQGDNSHTHWPYTTAFSNLRTANGYDFPGFRFLNIIKAVEAYTLYHPTNTAIYPSFSKWTMVLFLGRINEVQRAPFIRISSENKIRVMNSILQGYVDYINQFSVAQIRSYLPDQFTGECGSNLGANADCEADVWHDLARQFKANGLNPQAVTALHSKGQSLWPQFDWTVNR